MLNFCLLYSVLVSYELKKMASEVLLLESRLKPESKQVGFANTERIYTKKKKKKKNPTTKPNQTKPPTTKQTNKTNEKKQTHKTLKL